jgi:phosphotransferase system IIB component
MARAPGASGHGEAAVVPGRASELVAALGGPANLLAIDARAETRVRVEVADTARVDERALARAADGAIMSVAPGVWHLVLGLRADQYAAAMREL